MIEAHELTKRYGDTTAVHSLSFTIAPGTVTGFPYRQHRAPLREVGALLEASALHPGRSARSHLRSMAATHNIKASRVGEVIEMTGLAGVATSTGSTPRGCRGSASSCVQGRGAARATSVITVAVTSHRRRPE